MTNSVLLVILAAAVSLHAQASKKLELLYADETEFIFSKLQDTTFVTGSVVFETESGMIYCDSAMWAKGELAVLWGRVIIDDREYRLVADSVRYDLRTGQALARGSYVELWSRTDSLFAVGTHAFFDRGRSYFYMLERPTVYLNYPDSSRMIEVIADFVEYDATREVAEAEGTVTISSDEFNSSSGCAIMYPRRHVLDLFDGPVIRRRQSEIRGRLISVASEGSYIRTVDVIDSAYGEFVEPVAHSDTLFDRSKLSGRRILMDFLAGDLRTVTCYTQAYSWYYPANSAGQEEVENSVSGDTIRFLVSHEQLRQVEVMGGAIGAYMSTKRTQKDTTVVVTTDTIDYQADKITYSLIDSLITLRQNAKTKSGAVALEAYQIQLDTKERIIEAYSAALKRDTVTSGNLFADALQPNEVPVVLADRDQRMFGDYLRYSIDTEKGRIVTSKSNYETGLFYGENLHRQHKDIFYLDNGRYTTCAANEPHFHFSSDHLKLIEGKRLIARPVVLNIGRLPILALPYYVFPLEKGRHSGILPFSLGNIERGERYIRNVGYYWAASQYWDWQGALDYFEDRERLNVYSRLSYKKIYAFDGSVAGNWGRETSYDSRNVREFRKSRWTLKATHNHEITPSFKVSATGDIRSDPTYYNDYSTNLQERLNRVVRSQVNFTKRFGKSVSMSGTVSHDDQLDKESRTDRLPSLSVTLPPVRPFGSGGLDEEGKPSRRWYNELIITYRPRFENFSSRITRDSLGAEFSDTTIVTDTVITTDTITGLVDTTYVDSTVVTRIQDTLSYRSRKKFSRADHSVTVSFPLTIAKYFILNPNLNYSENWVKIHRTDQSDVAGIDASTTYRMYRYDVGASFSTKLYGTVHPGLFGVTGLRQVITPEVTYRFAPKSDRHPVAAAYAGASARSTSKSESVGLSLNHVYQAKIRADAGERNYELVSVTHSFSYDFEGIGRKYSPLSTSLRSNLLKNIRLTVDLSHSLYKTPTGNELDFWHPRLMSVNANATLSLRGQRFLFDDAQAASPLVADSARRLGFSGPRSGSAGGRGWDLSATYSYSETGKFSGIFRKSSSIRLALLFSLTPTTQIDYSEYYDFAAKKTIANQVSIVKTLHCWTGTFHWVPTGSLRGWGFMLYVTALPAVKIDNSQSTLSSSYFQGMR
ncbi:MAG: LPS assembly protein LptD [Candidatus Zixiibacteriota bacterium]